MEALLSNKNNSELDGLLKIKSRNEAELQELRQSIDTLRVNVDSLKRSVAEWQARAKQAGDEAEGLRNANKRLT
jgi:peptidoglycan hydrolase CwlO-like protein